MDQEEDDTLRDEMGQRRVSMPILVGREHQSDAREHGLWT